MKTAREVIDDPALAVGMTELLRVLSDGDGMGLFLVIYDGETAQVTTNLANRENIAELLGMISRDIVDRPPDRTFIAPKPS